MRWIPFFLLLYFMTALQVTRFLAIPSGGGGSMGGGGGGDQWWPAIEYLPLLAIFYALFAAETAAPLTALACGAAYDIVNGHFIGANAVPLGLTAWMIVRVRLSLFRENPLSQVVMTLLGVVLFAVISVALRLLLRMPLEHHSFWHHFAYLAGNAVYTSLAAPLVFRFLFIFREMLGFSVHGPKGIGRGGGRGWGG